ncbi:plasmid replication protein RepC [Rhizobium etli]|uniref:plasmid replication protein RepC n=1 Tax=Rhizobium etli TaxID=29449 RepID=UPI0003839149|nr:plasmid replication protein RepC [Rhizobium etli]AGS25672.1 replication initiation protein RepC 5 [Rhizobium etli bv. mimosae str. Mim1]
MDAARVTTPFGRRPMTLALLTKHRQAEKASPDIRRNKWKLFRAVCEARDDLNVSDRSLTVLDALLSFYPSDELSAASSMIVFPSNAQLSIRARGMTAATLRRHLAALVDAGLILRKDSPNGKRYARRSRAGDVSEAFGFSLVPLLCRAQEIEAIAGRISADRELFHSTRGKISLCRREITKLIQAAQDSEVEGEWNELHDRFRSFLSSLPRRPSLDQLQTALTRLTQLRARIINLLEENDNSQNSSANESQDERHIQDSQTNSHFESENAPAETPLSKNSCAPSEIDSCDKYPEVAGDKAMTQPAAALDTVLRACPDIVHYAPGGSIRAWRDLVSASAVLRSMLQINTSSFQDACRSMGPENAAIAIACIYERGEAITSAGAYLRDLSRRATQRQFTVVPMLTALLRFKFGKT